jgi:uncharacterized membrane protein YhfC
MLEPIPLPVVCMGEAEKGHTCRAVAAVVVRFACILLHCSHCSSSAHAMNKRQPLHTLIYGTMMGALMEEGALIMS